MRRLAKGVFYLAIPGAIALGVWQGWSWWSWATAPVAETATEELSEDEVTAIQLEIPPGTPAAQIGRDLEAVGLIQSANAWELWARWLRWRQPDGSFQAGVYRFSPQESMLEIGAQIWDGEVANESFTIPEGWSRLEMADYFERREFFSAEAFLEATQEIPRDRFPWLPEDIPHLEGYLFPDTYQVGEGTITPDGIVAQMLGQFERVALPEYEANQPPEPMTLHEWVTLGSIVEKEAVVAQERRTIAGVFWQRLRTGMNLGADPTVEYALGIRQTVDTPLTWTQVAVDSPYNTYRNPGLPPTAIASPGLASLQATLDPEETPYLYFVARYDGTHFFSRTLAEHEAAIARVEQELAQ
ncbi:endolytic transglycosylase MltG [Sodalinema gerasimenkoae]|uniref:endolytic transglycosylase MltG n=1 Tax=Sodalinema gerasimenkoae TaxID=2862348 RepID=UPI0013569C3B|nr:endolytic transglycosylase MltG [Sodalinema gerasimenkoae]